MHNDLERFWEELDEQLLVNAPKPRQTENGWIITPDTPTKDALLQGTMPSGVFEVWKPIWRQVGFLFQDWNVVLRLFGEEEAALTLYEALPYLSARLYGSMTDAIFLCVTRLTDPASQGRDRFNLTLSHLAQTVRAAGIGEVADALDVQITVVTGQAALIRRHRDKRISHSDLPTALGTRPLEAADRDEIGTVLGGIGDVVNAVAHAYSGCVTAFDHDAASGEARALVALLQGRTDP